MPTSHTSRLKGALYVIASSVIFGLSPIYFKASTAFGLSTVTFNFLRSVIAFAACFPVGRLMGIPMALRGKTLATTLLVCGVGGGITSVLLTIAYNFLSSGLATSLHFTYPTNVMAVCVLFFKEKISPAKVLALLLGIAAIVLFALGDSGGSLFGLVLALLSGGTYAFYTIALGLSVVRKLHPFVIVCYSSLVGGIASGLYGLFTGTLVFSTIQPAGALILLCSIPVYSFLSVPLFQLGVKYTGPTSAALLSMMEPVTSILCGALVLGEVMTPANLAGCLAILAATTLVVLGGKGAGQAPGKSPAPPQA